MNKQLLSFFLFCVAIGFSQDKNNFPKAEHNLVLQAPIVSWDEAIPLGNGLTGGLLWGEKNVIRLSLDRGDLWDERTNGESGWWKKNTYKKGVDLLNQGKADIVNGWWDAPYNGVTPTKLPAGRIEITLPTEEIINQFELNLATAEGFTHLNSKKTVKVMYSATEPIALISMNGISPKAIDLLSTLDVFRKNNKGSAEISSGGTMNKLGYPEAVKGSLSEAKWYIQEAADGLKYCVYLQSRQSKGETLIALTITSTNDSGDFFRLAQKRCESALAKGYASVLEKHKDWWAKFWSKSSVSIPDDAIQKQYNLVQYFYGAASRDKAPPMPLQGVWTADSGSLPPWKGDYHNDLNTQMTYMAYQESGRFDEGASYINYLWDRRDVFRAFAKDFYETDGLACPGVMSLSGQPLGGWGQYAMSPTMSAWSAHLFYLHWKYTADNQFLKEKAYPWCSGVGECMLGLLKPDEKGILKLGFSSSPEFFDSSAKSWMKPNTNYDLMCLKMLFLSLSEMAEASNKLSEIKKWKDAAAALGDFHKTQDGTLMLDSVTEMPYSHRHLSNIMGIYPFNLITTEGSVDDVKTINSSLNKWKALGTGEWVGYSFSWMSCMQARVGNPEEALKNLDIFVKAFVLRNGFHANGDQTKSGYSNATYKPFTLEGNFLASQAVQEMLLQSWSSTPGKLDSGIIRIFPATPKEWSDVSFSDLRAEGGYKVSAIRKEGKISSFSLTSKKTGTVKIKDNFNGQMPKWNIEKVKKTGDIFEINLKAGERLEAKF